VRKQTQLLRLWSEQSGVTAVELALLAAFVLAPFLLGATELGRRIWTKVQLDHAASAGVQYAVLNGVGSTTAINTAAVNATSLTLTATSSPFYGCPTSTGVTPQAQGSSCSSGGTAGTYVSVTATASYTPLFHSCGGLLPESVCPLTSAASSLSSSASARTQ
jgi:Flp pilus assembly protein TadG